MHQQTSVRKGLHLSIASRDVVGISGWFLLASGDGEDAVVGSLHRRHGARREVRAGQTQM